MDLKRDDYDPFVYGQIDFAIITIISMHNGRPTVGLLVNAVGRLPDQVNANEGSRSSLVLQLSAR